MKLRICAKSAYAEISPILGGREGNLTIVYEKKAFKSKKSVYMLETNTAMQKSERKQVLTN